jgi:transcriptional regulator with XRE-family HTH domain
MNEHIREATRRKMRQDKVTQTALAKRLMMSRTNLVRLMTGGAGLIPRRWAEVLDALELELIAVPRKDVDQIADDAMWSYEQEHDFLHLYDNMTPEEYAEAEEEISAEVLELRRRWVAGEFDNDPRETSKGTSFASELGTEFAWLGRHRSRYRPGAIKRLKKLAKEERQTQESDATRTGGEVITSSNH